MAQPHSRRPRRLTRITLCAVLLVLGCQSTLSVRTAAAAGSGSEAIQGLGSYFLTLPYGGMGHLVSDAEGFDLRISDYPTLAHG